MDPVSAIANAVGSVFGLAGNIVGRRSAAEQAEQARKMQEAQYEYDLVLSSLGLSAEEEKRNNWTVILIIGGVLAIIVLVFIAAIKKS